MRQSAVVGPAGHFAVGVLDLGHHATRVGGCLCESGGVIPVAVYQNGVRAGGRGAGPGVGRAAVGANVDGVGRAVGRVVVKSLIADAGLVAGGGRAQLAGGGRGVVVKPVAIDGQEDARSRRPTIGWVFPMP